MPKESGITLEKTGGKDDVIRISGDVEFAEAKEITSVGLSALHKQMSETAEEIKTPIRFVLWFMVDENGVEYGDCCGTLTEKQIQKSNEKIRYLLPKKEKRRK